MGANHADFFAAAPGGEDRTFAEVKDIEPTADYEDNFRNEDEGYLADSQGRNTGTRIDRVRDDQPVAHFMVKGQKVPFNASKMYEDWRSSKNDASIPSWKQLGYMDKNNPKKETPEHQADWQFNHPEGRALMAAARKKAIAEGPTAFDSDFSNHAHNERRADEKRDRIDTVFPSSEKADHFRKTGELQNMSDPDDHSAETDYHKAWFAHITSRPEVGYAPHADASSFEGIHNLIHTAVKSATGSAPEQLPQNSQVGQHAKNGLAAVARAAMHHTLGDTADATRELESAAHHVQNMMSAIKGQQMSAGQGVSVKPASEVVDAAKFVANYAGSVSNYSKHDPTKNLGKPTETQAAPGASNQRIANQRMGKRDRL
jgi:hypothetical protein